MNLAVNLLIDLSNISISGVRDNDLFSQGFFDSIIEAYKLSLGNSQRAIEYLLVKTQSNETKSNTNCFALIKAFTYLDINSLIAASSVCTIWHLLSNESIIWETQYRKYFPNDIVNKTRRESWKQIFKARTLSIKERLIAGYNNRLLREFDKFYDSPLATFLTMAIFDDNKYLLKISGSTMSGTIANFVFGSQINIAISNNRWENISSDDIELLIELQKEYPAKPPQIQIVKYPTGQTGSLQIHNWDVTVSITTLISNLIAS